MYWQTNPIFIIVCVVCVISIILTIVSIYAVGISVWAWVSIGTLLFMSGMAVFFTIVYVKIDLEERFGNNIWKIR